MSMEHEVTVKGDGDVTVKVTRDGQSASATDADPVAAALKAAEKLLSKPKKASGSKKSG